MKKILNSNKAPQAIGPYSQGVFSSNFLFLSGQIPLTPDGKDMTDKSLAEQTKLVLGNIQNLLHEAGLDFENVVKTTIFLTDMADFEQVNQIYAKFFKEAPPARSTVAVAALPKSAKVEIECIAEANK